MILARASSSTCLFAICLDFLRVSSALLEGPNVCTREETHSSKVTVSEEVPYRVKEFFWCLSVPPRCSKYRVEFVTVYRDENSVKTTPVEECCKGYTKHAVENRCVEVCSEGCDYFEGENGAICSSETGQCRCPPGWEGQLCDRPCSSNSYGIECSQKCVCKNGASCNPVDGVCHCLPGWVGRNCTIPCKPDSTGTQCTKLCPEGYYGDDCMKSCECKNDNFICHPAKGCICKQDHTGENCVEPNLLRLQRRVFILVACLTSSILLVSVVLTRFYHKKSVPNLKTENDPVLVGFLPEAKRTLLKEELQQLKNKDADATNPKIHYCTEKLNQV